MAADESWWELGACRTANPAIFDGLGDRRRNAKRDWSAAKRMCASCPVQPQCLDYALAMPNDVWADDNFIAGFTPDEIAEIRQRVRNKKVRR